MSVETVKIPLVSGKEIEFRKLDDGEAMRLLRDFFQITMTPESADAQVALFERLSSHLVTSYDAGFTANIQRQLPIGHPNLRLSGEALWLGIKLSESPTNMAIAISLLTELPAEMMRRMAAAAREGAASVRVERGKSRR